MARLATCRECRKSFEYTLEEAKRAAFGSLQLCVECARKGRKEPEGQPAGEEPVKDAPRILLPGEKAPSRPTLFGAEEGQVLTPSEAVKLAFLTICEQYQQIGKQMEFFSKAITSQEEQHADMLDLINYLRDHMNCKDAEVKTIGTIAFDPRLHCSKCSRRARGKG